ncbi:unnamed protein product [Rangifer tarandus platyrhynchus]|uniref:Uncharacterized protein n=2 Tax=Rangifer tarandus platyrhynchus TaxID=3082113 RepID=A0ABN8Y1X3_RANTA|nr:unnamed protein product [Rangifer tarandus platyrhynchus]CAI9693157.1 unnamed protein product [Rangifer tarandus platyrhynchus]
MHEASSFYMPSSVLGTDSPKPSSHCGDEGLDWSFVSSHSGVTHISADHLCRESQPQQEEAAPHLPESHQVMTRGKQVAFRSVMALDTARLPLLSAEAEAWATVRRLLSAEAEAWATVRRLLSAEAEAWATVCAAPVTLLVNTCGRRDGVLVLRQKLRLRSAWRSALFLSWPRLAHLGEASCHAGKAYAEKK